MNRLSITSGKSMAGSANNAKISRNIGLVFLTIVTLVMLIGLLLLSVDAHNLLYFPVDLTFTKVVQSYHTQIWFDLLMRAVGEPGYPPQVYGWLALALLIFWKSGVKWETVMLGFASVGIGVVGLIVKILVNRPRPDPSLISVANPALDGGKYSYPAGHVESYMAILGFFLFLSLVLAHKHAWTRTVEIIGFTVFLLLIGVSRIYMGEHWPSDVVGAYLLGAIWLVVTIALYERGKTRFFTGHKIQKKKR